MELNDNNIPVSILRHKTGEQVAKEAIEIIDAERQGEQLGLYTNFNTLNISAGKYFRFENVYLIAGLSGHGKSAFVNMMRRDFLNKELNPVKFNVLHLHFCYEMKGSDEVLRETSFNFGKSYSYLLSSEYSKDTKSYNRISEQERTQYADYITNLGKRPIFYFETAGNLVQLYNTVAYFQSKYPTYKLVITIDHTLLSLKLDEDNDLELMAETGKTAVLLRKNFGAMVIMLGQMNNNIEKTDRLTNKHLHYPLKSDIYAQSQVFNACDHVYVMHRPEFLRIEKYGVLQKPTKGLIHLYKLKARHGRIGSIWFKEDFMNGRILEITDDDTTEKSIDIIANNI